MVRILAVLLLATPLVVHAQVDDPLSSGECTAARTELEAALSDSRSDRRARAERLAAARSRAALACLGSASGQAQRSGAPYPAQVVPPPAIASLSAAPTPPSPAAPPPQLAIPRPAAITTCDPTGCWDSEGRRLNQIGPFLMGPRGLCSLHGGAVSCL